MSSGKPVLHALTGCTASGKTEWALRWAETFNAEIISSDSLLFYRGMNIGTAKPTSEELHRVTHHLVDVCEPTEQMNINRYVQLVRSTLAEIAARGRQALVVGGSGFYLKAFFAPVADDVVVAPEIRSEVSALSAAAMLDRLRSLNPKGLGSLDTSNPRRVSRALERCLASGKTMVELVEDFGRQPSPFAEWEVKLARLDREPAELKQRIEARVQTMLQDGLVDEVRGLLGRGLKENPSAARAIGYREVIDVLEGRLPEAELASTIAQNTRALVKKQRTWFRTQLPPHHVLDATTISDVRQMFGG